MQNETPAQDFTAVVAPLDVAGAQVDADQYLPTRSNERSCCCSSRPAVRVVLPPTPERDHAVDLLLCGHHYRTSRSALATAGVQVSAAAGAVAWLPGPA
jgi:hypothetical protein